MLKSKREKTVRVGGKTPATFYLDQHLFDALRAESDRTGASASEILRRSLIVYLNASGDVQFQALRQKGQSGEVRKSHAHLDHLPEGSH
jgi:negative regulator of replication initiation